MAKKTIDRLTPEGKRFMKTLKELKQLRVKIGYQRGKISRDGVDLADIAAFNDLGTARAPSRPFLRRSVDGNLPKIRKFGATAKRYLLRGASAKKILLRLGNFQKALIQTTIDAGPWVPNAPSTIRRKMNKGKWNAKYQRKRKAQGKAALLPKPLIDEGTMRKSVMVVIEKY